MSSAARILFQSSIRQRCYRKIIASSSTTTTTARMTNSLLFSCSRGFSTYPPHEIVPMPSLSPTMEAGTITKWSKNEGDEFDAGDILCEVETDKATVDFEAQDEGVIAKILVEEGKADIPCGQPILITVMDKGDVDAFKDYTVEGSGDTGKLGLTVDKEEDTASPPPPTASAPPAVSVSQPEVGSESIVVGKGVVASPKAHMIAKQLGYDISKIVGTGPGGRIIAADVQEYTPAAEIPQVATTTAAAPPPASAAIPTTPTITDTHTDYPLSVTAQQTASLLSQSKSSVPHYYLTIDLDLSNLLSLRSRLNATNPSISLNDLLIKAIATTTKSVPSVNASWISDEFIRMYHDVHVNTYVGAGDQLRMVCLRDVDKRGLSSVSDDMTAITDVLSSEEPVSIPSEYTGMGTFTMINLGMYGVSNAASIIPLPQACVLTCGAASKKIVPSDNESGFDTATCMSVTLSCDHRVVDGAVAAQWLSGYKNLIENPDLLLL